MKYKTHEQKYSPTLWEKYTIFLITLCDEMILQKRAQPLLTFLCEELWSSHWVDSVVTKISLGANSHLMSATQSVVIEYNSSVLCFNNDEAISECSN